MRHAGYLIATGVCVYFLVLAFTWPAVEVESYIEDQVPGLSLSMVTGSVYQGQAGQVSYLGTELGPAHWQLLPLALLTGRLEYHVDFSETAGAGRANAGVTFAGNFYGHDIDLNFSPDHIIYRYSPVTVSTSGFINLQVGHFRLENGFPREFTGRAVWKSAAILEPVEIVLGDTVLTLENKGDELVGRVGNEGDFRVTGEVALDPGGNYRVELLLAPEAGADSRTVSLLDQTTTAQPGGNYLLRSSGKL